MNIKKIAAAAMAATVLAATVPMTGALPDVMSMTANAVETEGDFEYSVNEDGVSVKINKYVGTDTEVVIPGSLGGKQITAIGTQAFYKCTSLASVEIPDSVTKIGYGAFEDCTYLKSVTIPDSVTEIDACAFEDCASLKNVTIPDSVMKIDNRVFLGCISLEEIKVAENNEKYAATDGVLFNKDKTELIQYPAGRKETSYTIPNSVVEIRFYAFSGCTLTDVTIPTGVMKIDHGTFEDCKTLKKVTIPDSVTVIGTQAFLECSSLANVTLPNSVSEIGASAFRRCTSLTSVLIPDSVTVIGGSAFLECTSLTSVTIPDSVSEIGSGAFSKCTSLTSVAIPDSVMNMGDGGAFTDCASLEEITVGKGNVNYSSADGVLFNKDKSKLICYPAGKKGEYTIPNSVAEICSGAFHECTSVENVTIPDTVTEIIGYTFVNCRSLISVTIPCNVVAIGDYDFYGCYSLEKVFYSGTKEQWAAIVIGIKNECLTNAEIICTDGIINEREPATEELKPGDIFVDGVMEYKVLEDGTLEVKGFANEELKETVEELIIPEEVNGKIITTISDHAFMDCLSLKSVTIPDSVTSIGDSDFSNCKSLEGIMVGENNANYISIDGVLFNSDKSVLVCYPAGKKDKLYTIPNSVTSIGYDAFRGCSSLESVTIGNGATSIDQYVFLGCSSLESVIIGNSVTSIGYEAFRWCSSLKSVTIPDSVTSIDLRTFDDCNSLEMVYYSGTKAE